MKRIALAALAALLTSALPVHAGTDAAYYPSYNKLRVRVSAPAASRKADLRLTDDGGKLLWHDGLALKDGSALGEFDVPATLDGNFTLTVTPDADGQPFTKRFKRVRYAWENGTLGVTERVYPPFEPIRVRGQKASAVLREYELDGLGLLKSVISKGQAVLASPMRLLANGEPVAKAEGRFRSVKDCAVVYEGAANSPAVRLRTHNTLEFDGCLRVELTLLPGDRRTPLRSLRMEIPYRDEITPFWHVCVGGIRSNPVGNAPAGIGRVWDSSRTRSQFWYGTFLPYLWFGNEEQGIAWFADNDRNWVTDPDGNRPCFTLDRAGGALTLGVELVQVPTVIDKPRTIVFGLIASPVKPRPANWRTFLSGQTRLVIVGSQYWAGDSREKAKYPRGYDFSPLDKSREARLTGKIDPCFIEGVWIPRHTTPDMEEGLVSVWRNRLKAFLNGSAAARRGYLSAYFEEGLIAIAHPELQTFGYEWSSEDFSGDWLEKNAGLPVRREAYLLPGGPGNAFRWSYRNFACHYAAEFIKRGVGIYIDNAFYRNQRATFDEAAYYHSRMDGGKGGIQPSSKAWAIREYYKRLWVLHRQLSPQDTPAMMVQHMTNGNFLSHVGFSDGVLDLEWKDNPVPAQQKYSPDVLRTESLGTQSGSVPMAIGNIWQGSKGLPRETIDRALRTRFGVFMVHEMFNPWEPHPLQRVVGEFGYGRDDCRVFNYWAKDYPVEASDELVKSILLKRGDSLLLVLCTWNPEPKLPPPPKPKFETKLDAGDPLTSATRADGAPAEHLDLTLDRPKGPPTVLVKVKIDAAALGVAPVEAYDAETKDALKLDAAARTIDVPMPGYGVRMVRINCKDANELPAGKANP